MGLDDAPEGWVYVFNGSTNPPRPSLGLPGGVFSSRERAEACIAEHGLHGTLTAYPVDQGAYEWAVANGRFKPERDDQRTPEFIGRFAGGVWHWHYEEPEPG